jgi:transposase
MTQGERDRLRVVEAILAGQLSQAQAAAQLKRSSRQVKRLCRRYRQAGAAGLVSKRRGKPGNRRIDELERHRLVALIQEHYGDFGPTLAAEYLRARHDGACSRETVRQWMIQDGLWKPRRARRKPVYQLRERRACRGELVQIDGSPHDWFEGRGLRCTLIAFVDDATGALVYARFERAETTRAYLHGLRWYVRRWGRPVAIYSDRHSIFTKHDPEDPHPTQLERAMRTLGIEPILARSPQAKGRVERSFQTLQDRLVKALRLAGACNLAQGNALLEGFIKDYNARFACMPANPLDAHRASPFADQELIWITSEQHARSLSRSLSCQYRGRLFAVDTDGKIAYHLRGARIIVCDDGDPAAPVLLHQGKPLPYQGFERGQDLPERIADDKTLDLAVQRAQERAAPPPPPWVPPRNHPWRLYTQTAAQARAARSGSPSLRPSP